MFINTKSAMSTAESTSECQMVIDQQNQIDQTKSEIEAMMAAQQQQIQQIQQMMMGPGMFSNLGAFFANQIVAKPISFSQMTGSAPMTQNSMIMPSDNYDPSFNQCAETSECEAQPRYEEKKVPPAEEKSSASDILETDKKKVLAALEDIKKNYKRKSPP